MRIVLLVERERESLLTLKFALSKREREKGKVCREGGDREYQLPA
jgi:hypothetical protein